MVGVGTEETKRHPSGLLVSERLRGGDFAQLCDPPPGSGLHGRASGGPCDLLQESLLDPPFSEERGPLKRREAFSFFFLILAASVLLFWNLGRVPLFEPDEGRYADMALTMVKTGDWLIPRMNGVTHLHKPPLSSWLVAASFSLLGPSEFSARLPGVLLSLLSLIGMIGLGRFLFDYRSGLWAAWILLTSVFYLITSRLVTPDIALTFFTLTAMFSFAHLFFGTRRRLLFFYTGILASAFGMLTKGPVAWLVTLLPALGFAIWKKKGFRVDWQHWAAAGILFLLISFGWYFLIVLRNQGMVDYFLKDQLLGRMFQGTAGHKHPFYYYFIVLPLGFLPWILFVPAASVWAWGRAEGSNVEKERMHFLLLWFLIPFVFLSLFRTKLPLYLVPLFPPLALLVGRFVSEFNAQRLSRGRIVLASAWIAASIYLIFLIGATVFIRFYPQFVAGVPSAWIRLAQIVLIVSSALMLGALLKSKFRLLFPIQAGVLMVIGFLSFTTLPLIQVQNVKIFVDKIRELREPGDSIVMYYRYFPSLPFYLKERVVGVGFFWDVSWEKTTAGAYPIPLGEGEIRRFVESKTRTFALTNEEGYEKAQSYTRVPLYPVLRKNKTVLFSNYPLEPKKLK